MGEASTTPPADERTIRRHRLFELSRRYSSRTRQQLRALQVSPLRWIFDIPAAIVFGSNLRALATLYGTDKWNIHWYAQHYEHHFRTIRRKRLTVLEIGIGGYEDPRSGGGSLRMWRTWFPNARIHGIDICDKSAHAERRITIHQGSQTDLRFLASVIEKAGRPDIIIDDGSHRNSDVIATFRFLFPHLADDGFYAVEDTQTSYWPGGNPTDPNDPLTSMGYFKSLVDGLNWEEYFGDYQPDYFDTHVTSIAFYHNLAILKKGANTEGSNNRSWHQDTPEWKAISAGRKPSPSF